MRCSPLPALLLLAAPLAADVVYLENGNRFEGVVTEESDSRVEIRLPFGRLELARASVTRIERSATEQREYFRRADALERDPEAPAEAWLELSQWARRNGLDHSASEAARRAALLAPRLPELAPTMRGLGFVLDDDLGEWLPHADFMRRRGFVDDAGEWVTRGELEARERRREEERRARRAEARDERVARAVEVLALSQLERQRQEAEEPLSDLPPGGFPVAAFPVPFAVRGGFFAPHRVSPTRRPTAASGIDPRFRQDPFNRPPPSVAEQLLRRQPGSLLPIVPPGRHRGTFSPVKTSR